MIYFFKQGVSTDKGDDLYSEKDKKTQTIEMWFGYPYVFERGYKRYINITNTIPLQCAIKLQCSLITTVNG